MSSYTQYLGSQRCCNLRTVGSCGPQGAQGYPGPIGPYGSQGSLGHTGPQGATGRSCKGPQGDVGSQGPPGTSGIGQTVTELTLNVDNIDLGTQTEQIAYYSVTIPHGDTLSSVTTSGLSECQQAIIFIVPNAYTTDSYVGTGGSPSLITGIDYLNFKVQQSFSASGYKHGILTITAGALFKYGTFVGYYN